MMLYKIEIQIMNRNLNQALAGPTTAAGAGLTVERAEHVKLLEEEVRVCTSNGQVEHVSV